MWEPTVNEAKAESVLRAVSPGLVYVKQQRLAKRVGDLVTVAVPENVVPHGARDVRNLVQGARESDLPKDYRRNGVRF